MGILQIHSLENVPYACTHCDSHIGEMRDIKKLGGETAHRGPLFTFRQIYNYIISGHIVKLQVFKGVRFFLVDETPIDNPAIQQGHEIYCKKCYSLVGWKLKENKFLIFANKIL
tara:strand:- start:1188 stop:1529 length:342 start_codon:yes stop_codon:yes gene_type:complete